jgi:hypothetical protein
MSMMVRGREERAKMHSWQRGSLFKYRGNWSSGGSGLVVWVVGGGFWVVGSPMMSSAAAWGQGLSARKAHRQTELKLCVY